MSVVAGKFGYMLVLFPGEQEAFPFDVTDWNVNPSFESVDTTNTNAMTVSGIWEDSVPSIYKADCSFSGPVTQEMFNLGFPADFSGYLTRVEFGYKYWGMVNNVPGFVFRVVHNDQVFITSIKQTLNVKGYWQYNISATSSSYSQVWA